MGRKKAPKRVYSSEEEDEAELELPVAPRTPTPKKKRSKFSEPFVDRLGWSIEPPSLIWKSFGDASGSKKIAAFNLESCLINRKSRATYPKDANDWRWWNTGTPDKLLELVNKGYKLVVFTNQPGIQGGFEGTGKEKIQAMIEAVYEALADKAADEGVDEEALGLQVFMAPSRQEGDPCKKPATGMWDFMLQNCNDGKAADPRSSFYVLDGSAQTADHSERQFAAAIGLPVKTPEEVFGPAEGKVTIGREAVKAAKQRVEAGGHPNADLVQQLREMGEMLLAAFKSGGHDRTMMFRANAITNASNSLATFPDQVCEDNLKEVGKLAGVGKGTIKRIKRYLETGSVLLEEEEDEMEALIGA